MSVTSNTWKEEERPLLDLAQEAAHQLVYPEWVQWMRRQGISYSKAVRMAKHIGANRPGLVFYRRLRAL